MVAFMSPFVFDTLSASKQLREAGMAEGVAEAVVSVFQHAATMPDISHLATKADVADMATKTDLEALRMATKADIEALRTATKEDTAEVKLEIANLRASVNETIRHQGWMLLGGVGVLVTILNGLMKMLG
jgi:hypothetical protein